MGLIVWLLACGGAVDPVGSPAPEAAVPAPEAAVPAPEAAVPAPPAVPDSPAPAVPAYASTVRPLSDAERTAMVGTTWHDGCPVPLDDLRAVEVRHWGLSAEGPDGSAAGPDGQVHDGLLVVARDHAAGIAQVFGALFAAEFPLTSVRPAHTFGGDDDVMMRANNTSAFNCRAIKGTGTYSEHSYGHAIDVNPLRNPWVRGDKVDPPEGRPFVPRDPAVPGVIVAEGAVVAAFAEIGWRWGGLWTRSKDYQHFSASGK